MQVLLTLDETEFQGRKLILGYTSEDTFVIFSPDLVGPDFEHDTRGITELLSFSQALAWWNTVCTM